ncbi:DNA repair protein RecO [Ancylomarina longa]|uniref:DNA repair protein RecO n=1 Tax=Ancylomarina longa TaxID=2487017 RepID=A0A434AWA9_9BACT|nr:DNA repair protein RecO [Ancylomarina longa]RUT78763.1 DNA repair protein RecO [Ancylomarina longa]
MIHSTKGIVLNQIKYGETSLIVSIYTEKFGRQTYMVKGARSKKSKNKNNLFRPFFLLDMEVYHRAGKNIQSLKEVRLSEPIHNLIFDVHKSTMVLFLAEVVTKVIREEEANLELFVFLYNSIRYLDLCDESIQFFHLYFLTRLTRFLGCYPQLNREDKKPFFDLDNGRFVSLENKHAHCLNFELSQSLNILINTSIDQLNELIFSKIVVNDLLRAILNFYALQIDGFSSLKSLSVIQNIFSDDL